MLNLHNEPNTDPISTIVEKISTINQTSNLLPIVTYPIIQCYTSWRNIFIDEYPMRSMIRAIISTVSFGVGPLLVQVADFVWLKDRCNGLYQSIPIFNLLPTEVGTTICSAYVCGYFLTWIGIGLTDIYNNYQFGGTYHYLTEAKIQQIYEIITNNNFSISPEEILDIFNKVNVQLKKDPTNPDLLKIISALRMGDFQTVLDVAHLLETQILVVDNKIQLLTNLQDPNNLSNTPVINNDAIHDQQEELATSSSPIAPIVPIASTMQPIMPALLHGQLEPDAQLGQLEEASIRWPNGWQQLRANENPMPIVNSTHEDFIRYLAEDISFTENISEPLVTSENHSNNIANNVLPSNPASNNFNGGFVSGSEPEHLDRNNPPVAAILHQYQSKKYKNKRALNMTAAIERLKEHKAQLKSKRFIDPDRTFLNYNIS